MSPHCTDLDLPTWRWDQEGPDLVQIHHCTYISFKNIDGYFNISYLERGRYISLGTEYGRQEMALNIVAYT